MQADTLGDQTYTGWARAYRTERSSARLENMQSYDFPAYGFPAAQRSAINGADPSPPLRRVNEII